MVRSSGQEVIAQFQGLTAKQCEVLDLLIEHKTSKEISRLLGISPHTVDQRIMLARSKLQVSNRIEVAQAYRRLRAEATTIDSTKIYQQTVYGSAGIAADDQVCHSDLQEAADGAASGEVTGITQRLGTTPTAKTELPPVDLPRSYYHVLPEAFDGRVGTLLRLGAIGMITVFLTLVILGGLVMYTQLSHMLDS